METEVCCVCGKGETELMLPHDDEREVLTTGASVRHVSHLDCVQKEHHLHHLDHALADQWQQRAEQAEAEVRELGGNYDRMRADLTTTYEKVALRCQQAEAEVARLKWMLDEALRFAPDIDEATLITLYEETDHERP